MPKPKVGDPIKNEDGSITTPITTYYTNGSMKTFTKKTVYPDGKTPKSEIKDEYKKGKGPKENGPKKKSTEVHQDEDGNVTKQKTTMYKKGVKNVERTVETKYLKGKPKARFLRRSIITIKYCPDGIQKEKQTTEVFDWTGQRWVKNADESSELKWNCETGQPIALGFQKKARGYALLIFLVTGIFLIAFGWVQAIVAYDIAGIVTLVIAFVLYRSIEADQRENLSEDLEIERAFWDESDEDQIENESTITEDLEPPQ